MANLLIRRASGGETFIIDDSSWPYFQSIGYVQVGFADDQADNKLYLSAAESDARYARLGGIADANSPTGQEMRAFFEQRIDRTGATTGEVPILQADGTLAFGPGGNGGGGGGGGTGTVTAVNGLTPDETGDVTLDADDLPDGAGRVLMTSAERALLTTLSTTAPYIVRHNGVTDPNRPSTQRPVIWVVPDADRPALNGNTSGGSYAAVDGLDFMWTF